MTVEQHLHVKVVDKQKILNLVEQIRKDNDPLQYIVIKYKEGSKDTVEVATQGEGGFDEFKVNFTPTSICWVFWRLNAGDDVSTRSKFVFLSWCGKQVKSLPCSTATTHTGALSNLVGYVHVSHPGRDDDEMNVDVIREKVRKAGGVRYDHTETFAGQEKQIAGDQRTGK